MSEKELNSYRFLSGKEPSDEMLESIMNDALEDAMKRKREAEARVKIEMAKQRESLRKRWESRLNSISNG